MTKRSSRGLAFLDVVFTGPTLSLEDLVIVIPEMKKKNPVFFFICKI